MKTIFTFLALFIIMANYGQERNKVGDGQRSSSLVVPETTVEYINDDAVYNAHFLQVQPEFPDGRFQLEKFYRDNIRYSDIKGLKAGTYDVAIQFVVEKNGSLSGYSVVRDPGGSLAKEVIRLAQSSKVKWRPGIQNGKPVRSQYTLPLTIIIP